MTRGGLRPNSGRKTPSSPYKEKTSVIRVPNSIKPDVLVYLEGFKKNRAIPSSKPISDFLLPADDPPPLELPVYIGRVSAGRTTGFASAAEGYEKEKLDLNKKLVKNPPATVYMWVGKDDDSMISVGIMPGALLIVDKSINARSGKTVVTLIDDEYVVKQFYKFMGVVELRSRNDAKNYPPITFKEGQILTIEGVVTHVVNPMD